MRHLLPGAGGGASGWAQVSTASYVDLRTAGATRGLTPPAGTAPRPPHAARHVSARERRAPEGLEGNDSYTRGTDIDPQYAVVMDPLEPNAETAQEVHERIRQVLPQFIGLGTSEAREMARRLGIGLSMIDLRGDTWHTSDLLLTRMTLYSGYGRVVRGIAG